MDAKSSKNKAQSHVAAIELLLGDRVPISAGEADRGFVVDDSITVLRAVQDSITSHALSLAERIAGRTVRKYSWIDGDDLQQELLIPLPRWMTAYNVGHSSRTSWSKYLYHKMNFYVKDVLRREDPVGIGWPQREHYPTWYRLGEQSSSVSSASESDQSQGGDCPADLLRRTLEIEFDPAGDEDEQIWQRDLAGLKKLASKNRRRKGLPLMVDAGAGVCRAAKCEYWDSSRGRVRFASRKSVSLARWIGHSRSQLTLW